MACTTFGLLGVVLLAGCGSSGTSAPTTAAYVSSANKVCASYLPRANALAKPTGTSSVAAVQKYLRAADALVDQETQKLQALPQPTSAGSRYSGVYAQQSAEAKKLAAAAGAGSLAQLKVALQGLQSGGDKLDAQFDAVGLKTCGSGS